MSLVLDQSQTNHGTDQVPLVIYGTRWAAQSFKAGISAPLDDVHFYFIKTGSPPNALTVELRNVSGGVPGSTVYATTTISSGSFSGGAGSEVTATFASPYTLVAGTTYAIVCYTSAGDVSNCYDPRGASGGYADGDAFFSLNSGGAWTNDNPLDMYFATYVQSATVQQTILSDASIKITGYQQTILSDAKLVFRYQNTILSDAKISILQFPQTILSDAKIIIVRLIDALCKITASALIITDINNKVNTVKSVITDLFNRITIVIGQIYNINNKVNIRALGLYDVNNDIRTLASFMVPGVLGTQSLGKKYIKVYLNSIEQTNVDIDSINIHKPINATHTASFELAQAYDVTAPALETTVEIKYSNWVLYKGYITEINPSEKPEHITINCQNKFWKQNRTEKYFQVGHKPIEFIPITATEIYYATINQALSTEFSLNVSFGTFTPEDMNLFGIGSSEALTNLITQCGNYGWYYDVDETIKLWIGNVGTVVNIQRQSLGQNLNLFHLLDHQFKESVENLANQYFVQMGDYTKFAGGQYQSYQLQNYEQFAQPMFNAADEVLAKNSYTGVGFDYHDIADSDRMGDVFKKFSLPYLNPKLEAYTDYQPVTVTLYSVGNAFGFVGELNLQNEIVLTEGFTIDYDKGTLTFAEPVFLQTYDNGGEIVSMRAPVVKVNLWKKNYYTYSLDPLENPMVFYTSVGGSYPTTIVKTLNLSSLSKQTWNTYKYYRGQYYYIPSWDDTNYALDLANWELSKTQDPKITGTIEVTLDTVCYYGIDLSHRIFIDGITATPMNIMSIDYNLSNFRVSIQLEKWNSFQRTVSLPWHGA
jgi:hypothetical protein